MGVCGFFLLVKFATSPLALLAADNNSGATWREKKHGIIDEKVYRELSLRGQKTAKKATAISMKGNFR